MLASQLRRQADRRTRHHMMVDGQINPREWFNWHPKEYQPWYFDRHKFLYEQQQYAQFHHLLCHQVYLKDILHLVRYPEPYTYIIDCRTSPLKMHRWVPHSSWLPRDEVEYALQLSPEEFVDMYGFKKPRKSDDIILVSHNGLHSEQAGWEWKKQFFQHVYNYRGGTNELFGELYSDMVLKDSLAPWKGPFPQSGIFVDKWSKRKVLTRTGPFDRQYEMQDFALPDLELEKPRHTEDGPRQNMPYGLQ
ncbi:S-adenosylmethionine synthetase [Trypanosoma theileri]|uniref:S-adenosylmethionine synthetase n=1 Tax=Trypanosoma theileri TaxID=67003 RepID=A0A1X0P2T4_9TRYP|nr:S-adenosylmethionine synthetase [Trypanosoma theileri]ORC90700.1 S-adenosylmethionine synthetase [Trypanosoma theileri]